jgi:hypothetical protein
MRQTSELDSAMSMTLLSAIQQCLWNQLHLLQQCQWQMKQRVTQGINRPSTDILRRKSGELFAEDNQRL